MKKYILYIVVAISLFVLPKNGVVQAAGVCDNKTIVDYREMLSNVKVYSDYHIENNQAYFDITITNIPFNVYVEDTNNNKIYKYENFTSQHELIIKNYGENQKLSYRFYIDTPGCYGELLGSRAITLPNYNENSTDPLCVGIEEFSLCRRWNAAYTSYSDFEKRTSEYRKQKGLSAIKEKPKQKQESLKNRIISFVGDYYIYLVAAVAVVVLILIALKTKAEEKSEFDFKV